jgi:hypothetical protein
VLSSLGFVEFCLKWKLRKGQAVGAGQVVVVAALVSFLKWNKLVMNVVCSLLAMYLNQRLVERLEVVVVLEELLEELYWQEWVPHLFLMGPEVEVSEQRYNCIGIQDLCLLLQSRTCRYLRFRKWSTLVAP